MKKSKTLLLLLVTVISVLLLASCDKTGDEPSSTTADQYGDSSLVVYEGSNINFKIIRPEVATTATIEAAKTLRKGLADLTGGTLTMGTDYVQRGESHDSSTSEILVGWTTYDESSEVFNTLHYGEYKITCIGNKIILAGADDISITTAVEEFLTLLKENNGVVPSDYFSTAVCSTALNAIPVYNGIVSTTYTGGANESGFVIKSTSLEMYNDFITRSEASGFTVYSSSDFGGMLIGNTLVKDNTLVTAFYTTSEKTTRFTVEKTYATALPPQDTEYTKVCESSITQLGLEYMRENDNWGPIVAQTQIGMSYIIQLEDGSFIIIDGGFNLDKNAAALYNKLNELAPDKNNITVAAWIFSHHHGDHTGAFRRMIKSVYYREKVNVEMFIYNFGSAADYESINNTETVDYSRTIVSEIKQAYGNAKILTAHPGQTMQIRNAQIDVLHTLDSMHPHSSKLLNGNSTSITVRITIGGQTLLFSGDSNVDATNVLTTNYGTYLKSDFVQIIHHGGVGATYQYYKLSDPKVALWPLGAYDYYPWLRYLDCNKWLFDENNTTIKQILLAASTTVTLPLPYTFPSTLTLPPEIEVTWKNVNM